MNLKTLIQIFLSILTISITILFFFKYFYNVQEPEELANIEKVDKKIIVKETTMDIIENLRFENIRNNSCHLFRASFSIFYEGFCFSN